MADVQIRGLRELGVALTGAPDKLKWMVLRQATDAMAAVIQAEASRRAPVATGKLSKNIVRRRQRPVRDKELVKVAVRRRVYYWWFQENGSARNAAHPYLRPAVTAKANEATNVFKDIFAAGVRKVMGV